MSERRAVTGDQIKDLLHLAGTMPSNKKAAAWLRDAIGAAQAHHRSASQRPLPTDHNELLPDIGKTAKQLTKQLQRLRLHPHPRHAFWRWSVFGPVYLDRVEIPEVLSALENIERAALIAKDPRTGRRVEVGKQHVVEMAFAFFVRYSPLKPSGTSTGPFARFARAFYETAIGVAPEKHGGLDRQIRQGVKRLPIQLERARRLRKLKNSS
jgi:hypothetical protein